MKLQSKLIIVATLLLSTFLFLNFDTQNSDPEEKYIGLRVEPLVLDNKTIEFPFTDDNSDESIIIKSDVKFFKENIKLNESALGPALKKREEMPSNFKAKAGTQIELAAKESAYLKIKITYKTGTSGEFWVEAAGDQGGYGLLDPWYSSGWRARKKITISETMVAGSADFTDFPIIINKKDPDWALTSAGGKVASGSGEFVFTGSDGITVLNHEIQAYDPSTGELAVWVVG